MIRFSIKALCVSLLIAVSVPAALYASDSLPVAVFRFEIFDSSGEGEHPEHAQRLSRITEELENLLAGTGRFEIVDLEPQRQRIEARRPLRGCNGCEAKIGADLGARYAFLGSVYKVSTLIMAIGLSVTDTETRQPLRAIRVGIRGDTDESWLRGVRYIFKYELDWETL